MRLKLLLVAGICLFQSSSRAQSYTKRPVLIEGVRVITKDIKTSNVTLDAQDAAAIIEELLTKNADASINDYAVSITKAVVREKIAKLSKEHINALAKALYLRAVELNKGTQLTNNDIIQLLNTADYDPNTQQLIKVSKYLWDLSVQEASRVVFDCLWSTVSNRVHKAPGNPPANP